MYSIVSLQMTEVFESYIVMYHLMCDILKLLSYLGENCFL